MRPKAFYSCAVLTIAAAGFAGCVQDTILQREDIAVLPEEVDYLDRQTVHPDCLINDNLGCRDQYVSMKMFVIDQNYAAYKILLSRGGAYENFAGDIAQIGLSGAASVIPVSQTTKVLSAASTAVGLTNTALNKDLLLSQTVQVLEQQMNTQRESVKQTILARLSQCSPRAYPAGFVLSDLQAYADAGTLAGALNGVAKSAANAKPTTNISSGTATPTSTSASPESSQAPANAAQIKATVTATTVTSTPHRINCPIQPAI